MNTKLERMAGYLAGRRDESTERIRQELEDPDSEASGFLDALRRKSRGTLAVDPPAGPDPTPVPAPRGPIANVPRGPAGRSVGGLALVVATVLIGVGVAWRAHDLRLRDIAASLSRGEERGEDRVRRLEGAVARVGKDPATASATARLEATLDRIERRLAEDPAAHLDPDDPTLARLRHDLDGLRQHLAAREKADAQDVRELRSTLEEALRSLRRLEARPPAPPTVRVPVPVLIPLPPQGHGPGLEPREPEGDHPSRGAGPQGPPGDRRGPPARTQKPDN